MKIINGYARTDRGKVRPMCEMFRRCKNLTELDVSGFDTSKVTDVEDMFYGCDKLTELDVSNFSDELVAEMEIP